MTAWPLICDRCGAEKYLGTLFGGFCSDCHKKHTLELLEASNNDSGGQSSLGDFA